MKLYNKISRLPINEAVITRPRVDALLEEGMKFPAVVVAAGAGFGKTQAVADFLDRSPYRPVWFQLTLLDNLPMRFWESFLYTVSLHRETLGQKLGELGFPDSLYKYHKFLQLLTEELYADDQFVVFVFDDFQLLKDESILQFFIYLVSANLENICLLFITRDLDSYAFNNMVHVLTTEDLRFTPEETAEYFASQGVSPASEEESLQLYSYTGGWPMALYLVALQLKKYPAHKGEQLQNSQQLIFRLIEKEIFLQYKLPEQRFFVTISLFNFFPDGLLRETGGFHEVDAEQLLQGNVFVSYDQKAKSYYLHQIFLDYLVEKQYIISEEDKRETFCRAAEWSAAHGYFADAIEYYDRCGEREGVWRVIREFDGMRHAREEAELFISYLEKFPEEFMHEHPMCRIVYGMMLFNNLRIDEAKRQVAIAHAQLEATDTPDTRALLGECYVADGLISLGLENNEFVDLFKQADALLPNGSSRWGKKLRLVEYSNALNLGSPEPGALEQSVAQFMEGMPYVSRVLHGAGSGLEYLAAAEARFLTGDLKEAQKDAYHAIYMAEEMDQRDIADNALFLLLRIFLVTGNVKSIEEIIARLQKNEKEDELWLQGVSDIAMGWFYAEIGEISRVEGWILFGQEEAQAPISVDKESLLHARCLIEQQSYFEALALLRKLDALYTRRNSLISRVYACVYTAIAAYQSDDEDTALQALREAYTLSHGNGLVMPFIEYGHRTRALLDFARKREDAGIPTEWLDTMHTRASTYAKRHSYLASHFRTQEGGTDFGLTKREIELLQNMSQGLTRDEIAASMYVSPHTVKSMLKTVYNKIGAINSADAVRIAIGADLI